MTMKGLGKTCVSPSIVTCRSSIASRSAAWVFGLARLISSASRICANTGPGRNSNSLVFWLYARTPVTSEGSRSGVNWMRRNVQSSERASDLASIVLPTPGTSSMRRCPSHRRVTRQSRISSSLLTIARLTFAMNASATRPTDSGAPIPLGIIGGPSWSPIRVEYGGRGRFVPGEAPHLNFCALGVVPSPHDGLSEARAIKLEGPAERRSRDREHHDQLLVEGLQARGVLDPESALLVVFSVVSVGRLGSATCLYTSPASRFVTEER